MNFDRKPTIIENSKNRIFQHATQTKSRIGVLLEPLNLFLFGGQNLLKYLDYPETPVLSCAFTIQYLVFFQNTRCNKDDI